MYLLHSDDARLILFNFSLSLFLRGYHDVVIVRIRKLVLVMRLWPRLDLTNFRFTERALCVIAA